MTSLFKTSNTRKGRFTLTTKVAALLAVLSLSVSQSAQAASATWTGINSTGTWTTGTNWSPAAAPGATSGTTNADIATFNNFGYQTITLPTAENIGGITFGTVGSLANPFFLTGGTLLPTAGAVIQTDSTYLGIAAITSPITAQGALTLTANGAAGSGLLIGTTIATAASSTLTLNGSNAGFNSNFGNLITGVISGSSKLVKSGTGTWYVSAVNSYSGGTDLNGGMLVTGNAASLGSSGTINVLSNTTLRTGGALNDPSARMSISDGATLTLDTYGQNQTWSSALQTGASHTGRLTKTGLGTLTLGSGASTSGNSYTGDTTINAGSLQIGFFDSAATSNLVSSSSRLVLGGGLLNVSGPQVGSTLTTTAGSSSATVGSTSNLFVGQIIYGNANVPAGTTITAINTGTKVITLSTGTGVLAGTTAATNFGFNTTGTASQTFNGTLLNAGISTFVPNASTGTVTVDVGSITRSSGSLFNLTTVGGYTLKATGTSLDGGGVVKGVLISGNDFATVSSGTLAAATYTNQVAAGSWSSGTVNYATNGAVTGSVGSGTTTINGLKLNNASSQSFSIGGTLVVNDGIIFGASIAANTSQISGGSLTGPSGSTGTGDLIIVNNNAQSTYGRNTISSTIVDNGGTATNLVLYGAGTGTLFISGANTYTGNTYVGGGQNAGGPGIVTVGGAAGASIGSVGKTVFVNGGTGGTSNILQVGNGDAFGDVKGTIQLDNGTLSLKRTDTFALSATVGGTAGGGYISQDSTGNATLTLASGTNLFQSLASTAAGTLNLGGTGTYYFNSNANGFNASSTTNFNSGAYYFTSTGNGGNTLGNWVINGASVTLGGGRYFGNNGGSLTLNSGTFRTEGNSMNQEGGSGLPFAYTINGGNFITAPNSNSGSQASWAIGGGTAANTGSDIANQTGGVVTVGSPENTNNPSTQYSHLQIGTANSNHASTYNLSGGTLRSYGGIQGGGAIGVGTGSNNFNWTGGTLTTGSYTATNLTSNDGVNSGTGTLFQGGSTSVLAPGETFNGQLFTGKTTITGNYQIDAGSVAIGIGGTTAATAFHNDPTGTFDNIAISSGTLNFSVANAKLNVSLLNSFVPTAGNSFAVVTGGTSLTGSFANVDSGSRINLTGGGNFAVSLASGGVTLSGYGSGSSLVWATGGTGAWDINTTSNFTKNLSGTTSASKYTDGDFVTFNDVAGTSTVTLGTTVTPGGVVFSNSGLAAYTVQGAGAIAGSTSVSKTGAGTVTLSTANSYTGGTTISAGTLKIGNATALGGNAGAVSVSNNGALDLSGTTMTGTNALTLNGTGINSGGALTNSSATAGTYAGLATLGSASSIIASGGDITLSNGGTITGATFGLTVGGANNTTITGIIGTTSGTLTKQDGGTLTLSGANTFSGLLSVQQGILSTASINNASANGVLGNSANSVSLGNTGGVTGTLLYTGATTSSSKKFTMATGGTGAFNISDSNAVLTLSGVIDGSGSLLKNGAGSLLISGANTFTGGATLDTGTLVLGVATAGTTSITSSPVGTGTFTIGNGTNSVNLQTNVTNSTTRTLNNAINLSGDATFSTSAATGRIALNTIGSLTTPNTITLTRTNTLTAASTMTVDLIGAIGGNFGLTLTGGGTFNIGSTASPDTVANTYNGLTTISGGNVTLNKTANTDAIAGNVQIDTTGTLTLGANNENINNAATVTVNTGGTWATNAKTETIGNLLVGGGTVSGGGTVIIASTGTTTVNSGTVSATNLTTGTGDLTLGSGATVSSVTTLNGNVAYNGATTGATFGTGAITLNGARDFTAAAGTSGLDLTVSGIVSDGTGTGSINKKGLGTILLNKANTYIGGTTLTAGTLRLGASTTVTSGAIVNGPLGTGTLTLAGGTLQDDGTTRTLANNVSITGSTAFSSTGATGITLNGTTNTTPATVTLNAANPTLTVDNTLLINDLIQNGTGTTGFTKAGAGKLDLSPSLTAAGTVTTNGSNQITVPVGTVVSVGQGVTGTGIAGGSRVTTVSGTTITLSANATASGTVAVAFVGDFYTGTTTINAGTLNIGVNSSNSGSTITSGATGTGNLTFASGSTATLSNSSGVGYLAPTLTLGGAGSTLNLTGGNRLNISFATLELGSGSSLINVNSKSMAVSGGNTLASEGTGLSSWEIGTTLGTPTIQNGTLNLQTTAFTGTNYGALRFNSGATWNNAALIVGPNVILNGPLSASGTTGGPDLTVQTGGIYNLANGGATTGTNTSRAVASLAGGGSVFPTMITAATGDTTLTLTGASGSTAFSGVIADGPNPSTGNGHLFLTKSGGSTQILSGNNTYTGLTTVSGGTVFANAPIIGSTSSSTGTGAVAVNGGGTLGGTGGILGAVTVAGGTSSATYGSINLTDGAVGTLSLGSTLTLGGTSGNYSTLTFELGNNTGTGDKVALTGALTLNAGGARVTITTLGTVANGTYTLLSYPSETNNAGANPFTFNGSSNTQTIGSQKYTLSNGATSEILTVANNVTTTATTYTLAASAAATRIFTGTSTAITSTITNTGTGTADTLNYTGLTASGTGTFAGPTSGGSGGPLAQGTPASTTGLTFTGTTTGNQTITPTVGTATNATLGGNATSSGTTTTTVDVVGARTVTAAAVNFGRFLRGGSATAQSSALSSTTGDSTTVANVTVNNGATGNDGIISATKTGASLFDGSAATNGSLSVTKTGTFSTAGSKTGSVTITGNSTNFTGELTGQTLNATTVGYTANPVDPRSFTSPATISLGNYLATANRTLSNSGTLASIGQAQGVTADVTLVGATPVTVADSNSANVSVSGSGTVYNGTNTSGTITLGRTFSSGLTGAQGGTLTFNGTLGVLTPEFTGGVNTVTQAYTATGYSAASLSAGTPTVASNVTTYSAANAAGSFVASANVTGVSVTNPNFTALTAPGQINAGNSANVATFDSTSKLNGTYNGNASLVGQNVAPDGSALAGSAASDANTAIPVTKTVSTNTSNSATDIKSAQFATGNSYAGYGLTSATSSGLNTVGTLLGGTAGGSRTVAMAYTNAPIGGTATYSDPSLHQNTGVTPNQAPNQPATRVGAAAYYSDVLSLSGTGATGGYAAAGNPFADTAGRGGDEFVLQMSYVSQDNVGTPAPNSSTFPNAGSKEDGFYIAWRPTPVSPATGTTNWINAVLANDYTSGGGFLDAGSISYANYLSFHSFNGSGILSNGDLGAFGRDPANNKAWAVLNHEGDFTVVPEAKTILAGLLLLGVIGYRERKRIVRLVSAA